MAWEARGGQQFYYRGIREGPRTKKVYCGGGAAGRLAAEVDEYSRAERRVERNTWESEALDWDRAQGVASQLQAVCDLVIDATLLAAGFHRASRHAWRKWYAGRRTLNNCLGASRGPRAARAGGPRQGG